MTEEKEFVKVKFEWVDEFGQKFKYKSKLTTANVREIGSFELQVEQFKQFLLAQGIHSSTVDSLKIKN